ncbi:DNA repair protein rev1 [Physcia stellaris]|nr:DNA repair protein rev1 [Physcia stellaris]
MGSRLETNSSNVRKRIEKHKFESEEGEEYGGSKFGGFTEYFRRKKIKLQNLDAELRGSLSKNPPIFRGIVAHVNGYTQPSLNDLHHMVVSYGGGFMQYLDGKTVVTHIIASNLTPKKKVEFSKYRIVKPAWIVDSIRAGKLLPWDAYRVVDEGMGQQVLGFDNGNVVSQANRSQTGYKDQTNTSWYTGQIQELANQLNDQLSDTISNDGKALTQEGAVKHSGILTGSNEYAERATNVGTSTDIRDMSESPTQSHDKDQFEAPSDFERLDDHSGKRTAEQTYSSPAKPDASQTQDQLNNHTGTASAVPAALPAVPSDNAQEANYSPTTSCDSSFSPSEVKAAQAFQTQESYRRLSSSPEPAKPNVSAEEHNAYLLADPKVWKSTVVNPGFLKQYYEESRLHHLSAWKADLKSKLQALAAEKSSSQKSKQKRPPGSRRYILHVDFDSFFAAVSLKKSPQYVDKPVVVAHGGGPGSEIASCNYPARKFGVRNGMWMKHAQKMCPDLKVLPYDFKAYEEASRLFYDAMMATGGLVQSVSVDEALVDVSNACIEAGGHNGIGIHEGSIWREQTKADDMAKNLRETIKETTGCAVSVGIGGNILLAKVALRRAKPAGQYHIKPEEVLGFIGDLTVQELPGVAYSIGRKLEELGVKFVKDLRGLTKERLMSTLGPRTGEKVWDYSRGIDKAEVGEQVIRKSVSAEVNWGIRFVTQDQADEFVQSLCEELHKRLMTEKVKGRQLTMKVMRRAADAPLDPPKHLGHGKCDTFNKSVVLGVATNEKEILSREAISIMRGWGFSPGELRGIGVQMTRLEPLKGAAESPIASSQRRLQFSTRKVSIVSPPQEDTIHEVVTPENLRAQIQHPAASLASDESPSGKRRSTVNTSGTQFVVPSQLDATVLAELPEDIRSKLMCKEALDSYETKAIASTPTNSRSTSPFLAVENIPSHSQIDAETLEALPEDVRAEVLAFYKTSPRKPNAQTRLPQSPHKSRIVNTKKQTTPTKNKKRLGLLSRIKGDSAFSTLTQSNFVANSPNPPKSKSDEQQQAKSAEITDEFLSALPPELRSEVLAQIRRERLQARGGIDVSTSKKNKRNQSHQTAKTGQRKLQLAPRPPKPTFTSRKLSELPELREAIDEWFDEFAGEGPYEEDVDVLVEYLRKVVQEEHNMAKAVGVSKWLAWTVEEAKRLNTKQELWKGMERWDSSLKKIREGMQRALQGRGLGRVDF